jgi:hypothetical protein
VFSFRLSNEFILKQKYTKESFVVAAELAANPIRRFLFKQFEF